MECPARGQKAIIQNVNFSSPNCRVVHLSVWRDKRLALPAHAVIAAMMKNLPAEGNNPQAK
jgi:hypothetical protein